MSDITIKALKNGPLRVEGKVTLLDVEGNMICNDKEKMSLCRCGHSMNKPFCDGTHNKIGFTDDKPYVPKT